MKAKNRSYTSVLGKIFVWILIALLFVGIVGAVFFFTNGFSTSFKTFYVVCNDTVYMTTDETMDIVPDEAYRFDVHYLFGGVGEKTLGYSVKVVSNTGENGSFDFIGDGETYSYASGLDLTAGFDIHKYDDYFVLVASNELSDILKSVYEVKSVEGVPAAVNSDSEYFMLVVTSEDEKATINIRFELTTLRLVISPGEIVF